MFRTYSVQEASELTGINRHYFRLMYELGILNGIVTGKGRRYSETELERFWQEYSNGDFSNPENIRMTASMHRCAKKRD